MRAQLGAVRAQQTAQRTSIVASSTSRLNAPAIRQHRRADGITLGSVSFVSGELKVFEEHLHALKYYFGYLDNF